MSTHVPHPMALEGGPLLVVEGGYAGWRAQALRALAAGWPPEAITWHDRGSAASILAEQGALNYAAPPLAGTPAAAPAPGSGSSPRLDSSGAATATIAATATATAATGPDPPPTPTPAIHISRALAALLQDAALYRSPERWALLYRVLWRWQRGDRAVASAADEDGARLHAMAKTVRRARHDMIAYVRFRRREGDAVPEYLAWYEPEHDVLPSVAEHFADRMGRTSWCIGTPWGAALWDGKALRLTDEPANSQAMREGAEADQAEPLWLVYYKSIFNPARLNEAALTQRMPVRFWKNLPEGPLIPAMVVDARNGARRVGQAGAVGAMAGKRIAVAGGGHRGRDRPGPGAGPAAGGGCSEPDAL